ncbi:Cyclic di-GMP phosphodiesterase [Terrisporobacter mayombei]|uniref:Cyclic di-GMP phosphodiesterase n=1 Tax=Terrisporobacter mayombei TaxID=1541 RepID=A0ABY9QAU1_9FIRM|nr:Cyclic di-GMP phosphodiesterase [Terrisporobacter mayombei]
MLQPGKLTDDEYKVMKTHSEKGYRLASLLPEISCISRKILTHHERWDGLGYPLGLQKYEIHILSRIVYVVDSFECYSKGRSIQEAIGEFKRCSGSQFDPQIVRVFTQIILKRNLDFFHK